jgi:hypothetical protein
MFVLFWFLDWLRYACNRYYNCHCLYRLLAWHAVPLDWAIAGLGLNDLPSVSLISSHWSIVQTWTLEEIERRDQLAKQERLAKAEKIKAEQKAGECMLHVMPTPRCDIQSITF